MEQWFPTGTRTATPEADSVFLYLPQGTQSSALSVGTGEGSPDEQPQKPHLQALAAEWSMGSSSCLQELRPDLLLCVVRTERPPSTDTSSCPRKDWLLLGERRLDLLEERPLDFSELLLEEERLAIVGSYYTCWLLTRLLTTAALPRFL